jgi:hypothetical protein
MEKDKNYAETIYDIINRFSTNNSLKNVELDNQEKELINLLKDNPSFRIDILNRMLSINFLGIILFEEISIERFKETGITNRIKVKKNRFNEFTLLIRDIFGFTIINACCTDNIKTCFISLSPFADDLISDGMSNKKNKYTDILKIIKGAADKTFEEEWEETIPWTTVLEEGLLNKSQNKIKMPKKTHTDRSTQELEILRVLQKEVKKDKAVKHLSLKTLKDGAQLKVYFAPQNEANQPVGKEKIQGFITAHILPRLIKVSQTSAFFNIEKDFKNSAADNVISEIQLSENQIRTMYNRIPKEFRQKFSKEEFGISIPTNGVLVDSANPVKSITVNILGEETILNPDQMKVQLNKIT